MRAADIMTRNVVTVMPEVSVSEIAKLFLDRGISAVPVVDADGQLLGIVSEGDLMRRQELGTERHRSWWLRTFLASADLAEDYVRAHGLKARDVMTTNVITVGPDQPIAAIANLLEKHRIKRVPVVEGKRVIGIVSRANLIHALAAAKAPPAASADDRSIRERLLKELEAQPWASTTLTNAVVADGVVHLYGIVTSEQERRAIGIAAERVPGVREVKNHLTLRPVTLLGT